MGLKAALITGFGGLLLVSHTLYPSEPRNGTSREEIANILLTGEMPQYWRAVEENAPELFESTVDVLYQSQQSLTTETEVINAVNAQFVEIFRSLTDQSLQSLTDAQRREILDSYSQLLISAQDHPDLCSDIVLTGGQNATQSDIILIGPHWDEFNAQIVRSLTQAQEDDITETQNPGPAISQDYAVLVSEAFQNGLTQQGYRALSEADASNPDFCTANISIYTTLVLMEGESANRLRHDETNLILIGER